MKYCNKCGRELDDEAVICPGCGCLAPKKQATSRSYYANEQSEEQYDNSTNHYMENSYANTYAPYTEKKKSLLGLVSIILGIAGIIFACCFALIGHIASITGIIIAIIAIVKASKDFKGYVGLGICGVAEVLAIISSVIGAAEGMALMEGW